MSEYARCDLSESLNRVDLPAKLTKVWAAWGVQGREYGDWTGEFLLELADGQFAYLYGWSDSSGWG